MKTPTILISALLLAGGLIAGCSSNTNDRLDGDHGTMNAAPSTDMRDTANYRERNINSDIQRGEQSGTTIQHENTVNDPQATQGGTDVTDHSQGPEQGSSRQDISTSPTGAKSAASGRGMDTTKLPRTTR